MNDGQYLGIGTVFGGIAAVITFIGSYIYCITTYGFLFGFGLGWLPSAILAVLVFFGTMFLWGPILLLVAIAVYYLFLK